MDNGDYLLLFALILGMKLFLIHHNTVLNFMKSALEESWTLGELIFLKIVFNPNPRTLMKTEEWWLCYRWVT
jgi:hypothetical protein